MAITPEMISEKSFTTKFKGYNMDEVDDFLDYVMDEVDKLIRENKALSEKGGGADRDTLVKLTSELEATRAKLKQAEAARERSDDAESSALRAELKKAQRRIAELESSATDSQELNNLRGQLMAAQAQIAQLESKPMGLPSMEVDNLKGQLAQKEAELRTAQQQIAALKAAPKADDAAIEAASKQAQQIIADAKLRSEFMIKDVETQTRKALAAMRVEVDDAQKEFDTLRGQIREVRNRYVATLQNQMRIFDDETTAK
jgi:DivIVA domain-containing protein